MDRRSAAVELDRIETPSSGDSVVAVPWSDAQTAGELNDLAGLRWQEGNLAEAERLYAEAHRRNPLDPVILSNLGNVAWAQRRAGEAIARYRQVLSLRPELAETWINLGVVLSDEGKYEDAEECFERALTLRPGVSEIHLNLGMTLGRQGRADEALAAYDEALRLRPDYAEAHRNRGMILLGRGDFTQGWAEYEWRLRCWGCQVPTFDRPRWRGEPLQGRTILLHAEQGLGDTLQFARFAAEVNERGGRAVLLCAPALVRLLQSCQGIKCAFDSITEVPAFDVHAPLLSLPAILGTTLESLPVRVPYLFPVPELVERWNTIGGGSPGLRVGIAWQGNPRQAADRQRSFPLERFEPLARLGGVRLISLQRGFGSEQIEQLSERFRVEDPVGAAENACDFADTAAMMAHLDLVITADSAVAHLAGALGVNVWVALRHSADWRYPADRSDNPWYPTMRIFRQERPGDWDGVFRRIEQALAATTS